MVCNQAAKKTCCLTPVQHKEFAGNANMSVQLLCFVAMPHAGPCKESSFVRFTRMRKLTSSTCNNTPDVHTSSLLLVVDCDSECYV